MKPPWKTVIRTLPAQLDLVGFAIFAPAAIMLLLALEYGGIIYAWNSRYVIGLFCGAGVTFLLWLAWDYHKGDAAMIPLSMAKKRVVWSGCLTYGFFLAQMFTVSYYLPIYFQAINGASPTLSGVYMLPLMAPHVAFSFLSGVLGEYLFGANMIVTTYSLIDSGQGRLLLAVRSHWRCASRRLQWALLNNGCGHLHGTVGRLPGYRRRCSRHRIAGGMLKPL